jgi:hypothetical protein
MERVSTRLRSNAEIDADASWPLLNVMSGLVQLDHSIPETWIE